MASQPTGPRLEAGSRSV